MNFTYNGNKPSLVNFNGNSLNKVTYNGTTVWEKYTKVFHTSACWITDTADDTPYAYGQEWTPYASGGLIEYGKIYRGAMIRCKIPDYARNGMLVRFTVKGTSNTYGNLTVFIYNPGYYNSGFDSVYAMQLNQNVMRHMDFRIGSYEEGEVRNGFGVGADEMAQFANEGYITFGFYGNGSHGSSWMVYGSDDDPSKTIAFEGV